MKSIKTLLLIAAISSPVTLPSAFAQSRDNSVLTWIGSTNNTWDNSTANWQNETTGVPDRAISGDVLNFDSTTSGAIEISSDGVSAAGIYFSGSQDYVFTGGGITTTADGTTLPTEPIMDGDLVDWRFPSASGKLVIGGKADTSGYIGLVDNHPFNGVVDFTGVTGTNNFVNGISLSSGTLRVANAAQLGTSLGMIAWGSVYTDLSALETAVMNNSGIAEAISDARASGELATLQIAGNMTVSSGETVGFANGDWYNKGSIHLEAGQTLTFDNTMVSIGSGYGSVFVMSAGEGARFVFQNARDKQFGGAMSTGDLVVINNAEFINNQAANAGGAIFNAGNYGYGNSALSLTDAIFSGNTAGAGGAIWTQQGGVITLTNVDFLNNSSTSNGSSLFYYGGGAIHNRGSTININVTGTNTATFSGNVDAGGANSIHFVGADSMPTGLNVNTDAGATLDMRDSMSGITDNSNIQIKKDGGTGTWKLGGASMFEDQYSGSGLVTTFDINAGTLHLYRGGEVDGITAGSITLNAAGSSFSLASGATLSMGGGNYITVADGGSIAFADGSTLAFDIAQLGSFMTGLSLRSDNLGIQSNNTLNFDVNLTSWSDGQFTLLDTNTDNYFGSTNLDATDIKLNGVSLSTQTEGNERYIAVLSKDAYASKQLILNTETHNIVNTWTGVGGSTWGTSNGNWSEIISKTYLNGDAVNFDGSSAGNIAVASGGVTVSGMYLSGSQDYEFSGGRITGSNSGTTLSGSVSDGKLILGAKANDDHTLSSASYTGTATFNNETNFTSVEIDSGTLHARHQNALGYAAVSVNSSGVLKGTTTLGGVLTVASGGILAPGNSAGTITLTAAGNTFQSGSIYEWELFGNGASHDNIVLTAGASLVIESGAQLQLIINTDYSDVYWGQNHSFEVVTGNTNAISGVFDLDSGLAGNFSEYGDWSLVQNGDSVMAQWTAAPIPEPSTYAFMGGAAAIALLVLRRRRNAGKASLVAE